MNRRIASVASLLLAASAFAQTTLNRPVGQEYVYDYNSGVIGNPGQEFAKVAQVIVSFGSASWQRILFSELRLENGSYLVMTSLKDGEFQRFDAATAEMWSNGSAYFNGDQILLELYAAPGTTNNKIVINKVAAEMQVNEPEGGSGQCGICGATDDRVLSNNDAVGRMMSIGCTATTYCRSSGMVTAGHCLATGLVVHFRVPASTAGCATVAPGVDDQFPVIAFNGVNGGVGNDYGTLRMGTNGLGQTPYHRYNTLIPLGAPTGVGTTINFWGYGVDLTCTRTQVSQYSTGQVTALTAAQINYNADLRGGNSGSSILNAANTSICGIVTHCTGGGVCNNYGTTINLPAFVASRNGVNPACTSTLLLLSVQSAGAAAVPITVGTPDVNALQNGTSDFKRVYASGTSVSFTAPATSGGLCFTGWTLNGVAVAGNPATISVTADGSMVANYGSCGPVPPPNNACAAAIDVSAGGTFNGTLIDATNDGTASCGVSAANPDVWYTYTNSTCATRVLSVNTCGSNVASGIDTVLSLHNSCGGADITCNDDTAACTGALTLDSAVSTVVAPGATVKIRVSKYSARILAPFILNVSSTMAYDNCADANLVPAGSYPFCNVGANTDGPAACGAMGADLWYRYTATANGLVNVTTCGTGGSFDSVVAVYPDGCPAGTSLACNDDDFNAHCGSGFIRDAWTQFSATAGVTYLVRVGGYASTTGSGTLTIERFCAADFNGDGAVDFFDYLDFVDAFSAGLISADFNGDGAIDFFDYLDFVDAFSLGC